jgi:hypothetical protein
LNRDALNDRAGFRKTKALCNCDHKAAKHFTEAFFYTSPEGLNVNSPRQNLGTAIVKDDHNPEGIEQQMFFRVAECFGNSSTGLTGCY